MNKNVEINVPSIIVNVHKANEIITREILAGIEEEGIPYKIINSKIKYENIIESCYKSSEESKLGISITVDEERIVVHYNKLKKYKPLVDGFLKSSEKEKARIIGSNVARLYKREPFKEIRKEEVLVLEEIIRKKIMEILQRNIL